LLDFTDRQNLSHVVPAVLQQHLSYFPLPMALMDDISIQVAPISRRFLDTDLLFIQDGKGTYLSIATEKPIYDIRGSYTYYSCNNGHFMKVGANCSVVRKSGSNGICFIDNFNDWHCRLRGGSTFRSRIPLAGKGGSNGDRH
jgi:hypothetical protein